ncbi:hypothetical protein LJC58_09415 [Lachnospiraceae bacterium OttesenSCG-928-D06]|nr:hypothetical protein [Lachnospiraceae bacterium OttesenSCG-928-D06]
MRCTNNKKQKQKRVIGFLSILLISCMSFSGCASSNYELPYNKDSEISSFNIISKKTSGIAETGIVAYWTDGYENLTPSEVSEATLSKESYEKKQLVSTEPLESGQAVYKLSTKEDWSIVVQIEEERAAEFEEEKYIKVRFLKNQYESWGKVTIHRNADGNTYMQLSFTNSMVTFVSDRFLDIELLLNDKVGLKIPNSAIVEKNFFLIPEEYIHKKEDEESFGIMIEYYEEGGLQNSFVDIEIYSYDEDTKEYYVESSFLDYNSSLISSDKQKTYTVKKQATLVGVYNINKGYADFRQIHILYANDEYSIVESNTKYGLNVYDYIVQDASAVTEDQFIYE